MSSLLLLCAHLVLPTGRECQAVTGDAIARMSGGTRARKGGLQQSSALLSGSGGKALLEWLTSALDLLLPGHALRGG